MRNDLVLQLVTALDMTREDAEVVASHAEPEAIALVEMHHAYRARLRELIREARARQARMRVEITKTFKHPLAEIDPDGVRELGDGLIAWIPPHERGPCVPQMPDGAYGLSGGET